MVEVGQINDEYKDKIGKKILVRRKSSPTWLIVGKLQKILGTKLIIEGPDDCHTIDYEDILSLDIKGKEEFRKK